MALRKNVVIEDPADLTDKSIIQYDDASGMWKVNAASARFDTAYGASIDLDGVKVSSGSGSPESSVTAPVGSMYLRSDGGASTTLYVKESGTGNTGWVAK